MDLILASNSARRKEIFRFLFPLYRSVRPTCEELDSKKYRPDEIDFFTHQNAQIKANCVFQTDFEEDAMIIACDTAIATSENIVGKPRNEASAFSMLKSLSGTSHTVVSSVIILRIVSHVVVRRIGFSERTKVTFSPLQESEIRSYIATSKPFDKAGAYGIQEVPSSFISSVEGSIWNVVGFPVETFCHVILPLGVTCKELLYEHYSINGG
jgi:septum formation protein